MLFWLCLLKLFVISYCFLFHYYTLCIYVIVVVVGFSLQLLLFFWWSFLNLYSIFCKIEDVEILAISSLFFPPPPFFRLLCVLFASKFYFVGFVATAATTYSAPPASRRAFLQLSWIQDRVSFHVFSILCGFFTWWKCFIACKWHNFQWLLFLICFIFLFLVGLFVFLSSSVFLVIYWDWLKLIRGFVFFIVKKERNERTRISSFELLFIFQVFAFGFSFF